MTSIIIPIYNAAPYLPTCVDRILAQTEQDFELILVDDGSTDDSWKLAQHYAQQDRHIIALQQAHSGQSAARNMGLQQAKGQFIAFVDADDSIAPDWLEQHLSAIEGVDYVQSGYTRQNTHQLPRTHYQFTSPCMRLYRREAIEGLRFPEGMIYEDVVWSVDLWLRGATCRIIHYTGYHYTVTPNSTTSHPHPEAQQKVIRILKERFNSASLKGKCIVLYTIIRLKLHFLKS